MQIESSSRPTPSLPPVPPPPFAAPDQAKPQGSDRPVERPGDTFTPTITPVVVRGQAPMDKPGAPTDPGGSLDSAQAVRVSGGAETNASERTEEPRERRFLGRLMREMRGMIREARKEGLGEEVRDLGKEFRATVRELRVQRSEGEIDRTDMLHGIADAMKEFAGELSGMIGPDEPAMPPVEEAPSAPIAPPAPSAPMAPEAAELDTSPAERPASHPYDVTPVFQRPDGASDAPVRHADLHKRLQTLRENLANASEPLRKPDVPGVASFVDTIADAVAGRGDTSPGSRFDRVG